MPMQNIGLKAWLSEHVWPFFKDRFDLHEDSASEQQTIDEIKKGVVFRGANLWILMFAIMVASVGLNVNSTAVVIGAMLISPIMGPILGVGLGIGIYDFELIIKSLKNLGIAVGISIVTSTLYFLISPLSQAQSELLARTTPTLWDVLIAFFGGLAGIVAGSRREKSNAIPGVAIATALIPPLCTSGFGIATGQWDFFLGAFYLFFINGVFISLATFLIVRLMRYPRKEFLDESRERKVKLYIAIFVIATILPSIYTAYHVIQQSIFEERADQFVKEELGKKNSVQVLKSQYIYSNRGGKEIILTMLGDELDSIEINKLYFVLGAPPYSIGSCQLQIKQVTSASTRDVDMLSALNQQVRVGVIEELYKRNEENLKSKDQKIQLLEEELIKLKSIQLPVVEIAKEAKAILPTIQAFTVVPANMANWKDSLRMDSEYMAYMRIKGLLTSSQRRQMNNWLQQRLQSERVTLVIQ